jgi:hypothetical protein
MMAAARQTPTAARLISKDRFIELEISPRYRFLICGVIPKRGAGQKQKQKSATWPAKLE